MYIKSITIQNIKSISNLEMTFENYAGWHVVIGDNGAGKTSFIKAVAIGLVGFNGFDAAHELRIGRFGILKKGEKSGRINMTIFLDSIFDKIAGVGEYKEEEVLVINFSEIETDRFSDTAENSGFYHSEKGNFSTSYGAFRRFESGNKELEKLFTNPKYQRLAAHLTALDESVALSESLDWFKDLRFKQLEGKEEGIILDKIRQFINSSQLLPHETILESVSSDGVFFRDGNGATILINDLSDGYRSVLSMTFELIRQLIRFYGQELVFRDTEQGIINLPGVVLIDEVDAHLHPTWQKEIGFWFTKYFPKIQFIVTTHSPLVCRAVEKGGSVWRLPAQSSTKNLYQVQGAELNQLIYGNILDAYSTDNFGENVIRSESGNLKLQRLAKLNMKKMKNTISPQEEHELVELRFMFPSTSNRLE